MNALIEAVMPHLIIAPILLPLVAAALMLFMSEQQRYWKALINVSASLLGLLIALALLARVHGNGTPSAIGIYLPANWDVPFGIVLASLLMALLYLGGETAQLNLDLPAAISNLFQGTLLFILKHDHRPVEGHIAGRRGD